MQRSALRAAWWSTFTHRPQAVLKCICFPYAGGSAAVFRHWDFELPGQVELSAIRLPGRGERLADPPVSEWSAIVPPLAAALASLLDRPFVFFGHSLGAVLGFEVARWLRRHHRRLPERLLVSGRRAPHLPATEALSCANDDELVARLRDLKGTPPEILQDAELLASLSPRLRADFELADRYTYVPEPPLECPITALCGADDQETDGGKLEEWREHTHGVFTRHVFEGDHFFIHSREPQVLALVRNELLQACNRLELSRTR